ncbi:MAG: ABC transporter permease, partial [Mycobacteriales bacterium]
MTTGAAAPPDAAAVRSSASLAARQVGYQLLLLSRSPLGTFTVLVVPLMLLWALTTMNPQSSVRSEGFAQYADFLTPAMAVFALLNACYVNVATSVVTAREAGVLKRLHCSPLPLWAYVVGRLGAAAVVGGVAFWAVVLAGWLFLDVPLDGGRVASLLGLLAVGVVTFSLLGVALSTVVRSTDSALPVAFGTLLPVAFVSDVFFPIGSAPAALRDLARALPVAPVSRPVEQAVRDGGWPMSAQQALVLLGWTLLAAVVTVLLFSWEPGGALRRVR